jgi:hypothetical protein
VCPKRSVQVFIFLNSGIPLAIFSDRIFSEAREEPASCELAARRSGLSQHVGWAMKGREAATLHVSRSKFTVERCSG